jgi:hypothetical protein
MRKATSKRPKKASRTTPRRVARDEIRPEYDFSKGVRGKYAKRYAKGTNLVLLDPDVAAQFGDAKAVNRALRAYLKDRSKRRTA